MAFKTCPTGWKPAARMVKHFVVGAHRLAITSESLAELLGLSDAECQAALEALAARGALKKVERDSDSPLYCKG
ncbi:MAG: hypothetical protein ACM3US_03625 [Sphingomonadaceae bacterium]